MRELALQEKSIKFIILLFRMMRKRMFPPYQTCHHLHLQTNGFTGLLFHQTCTIIIIIMPSFVPISSMIKLSGATEPRQSHNRKTTRESSMDG